MVSRRDLAIPDDGTPPSPRLRIHDPDRDGGEPAAASSTGSVLLIEPSVEAREVLRTVLVRRGMTVHEADEAREGLAMLRLHQPDVTVLDLEAVAAEEPELGSEFDSESESGHRLVVLGTLRRSFPTLPPEQILAKPYHFAPLVRTIELLVEQAAADKRAA